MNNESASLGGGVHARESFRGELVIENSIIANNLSDSQANDLTFETLTDPTINHSLIGVADTLGSFNGDGGNLLGTAAAPLDPLLGELADNGGPTRTHALLADSPAINAGRNAFARDADGNRLEFDQRGEGFIRANEGVVDMGAFESEEAPSLVVSTNLDVLNPFDGLTSLREAIAFANGLEGEDTITFDSSLAGATIQLDSNTGNALEITDSLVIDASAFSSPLTIVGNGQDRVINFVVEESDLTIDSLTITGGTADNGGGLQFSSPGGTLTINNSTIAGNAADNSGGGVFASLGAVFVNNSTISNNTSGNQGGGIFTVVSNLTLSNSTISQNSAGSEGGGLFTIIGTARVNNSTVFANVNDGIATGDGGIFSSELLIENSIVAGNTNAGSASDIDRGASTDITINNSLIGAADNFGTINGNALAT